RLPLKFRMLFLIFLEKIQSFCIFFRLSSYIQTNNADLAVFGANDEVFKRPLALGKLQGFLVPRAEYIEMRSLACRFKRFQLFIDLGAGFYADINILFLKYRQLRFEKSVIAFIIVATVFHY